MSNISLFEFGGKENHARKLQKKFIKYFSKEKGVVVDVGCGRGIFLSELLSAGYQAIGVDAANEAIEFCHEKGLKVIRIDGLDYLQKHTNQFGGVFLSHVVEHLTPATLESLLVATKKSLIQGGRLVIVTPNVYDLWTMTEIFWLDITHVRPYPLPLLLELCKKAGFKVIDFGTHGLGWRAYGRRRFLEFWWRRLVWGLQYGQTDAYLVVEA